MTFADRAILMGLVALAVPVVIHLLGRRRPRRVELPTARFAEGAGAASRGRLWLKRLGLLALRMAAVGLLVLALAGPRLGGQGAPGGRWALVLDASPSMLATDAGDMTAFDRSRVRLARILGALDAEASVRLTLTDGREAEGPPETVRQALEQVAAPSWGSQPLEPTIRQALAGEAPPDHLVLATDATPPALAGLEAGAFAEADPAVTLLATPPAAANARLTLPRATVETEDGRPVVCIEAEVRTTEPETHVQPSLALNGTHHRGKRFRGNGRVRFRAPRPDAGPWQGAIRVGAEATMGWSSAPGAETPVPLAGRADVLSVDNVRYFTAAAPRATRVLVVDAADEADARVRSADLVAAAFAGETKDPKRATQMPAANVTRADVAGADVVAWVGPKAPADASVLRSASAVLWVPADVRPPAADLAQALGVTIGDAEAMAGGATLDPGGYVSPLLTAFEGGTSGDLAAPVFRRRLTAGWHGHPVSGDHGESAASHGHASVAMPPAAAVRFRDGGPALVEARRGDTRVAALLVGPSPVWGDVASRPEWVVLAHSLVEALAPRGEAATLNLTVDEAAARHLPNFNGKPGNFSGADAGGRPVYYSVNVDPAETANLAPAPERLESAFAADRLTAVTPDTDALSAIPGLSARRGVDLTPWAVVALAAVLMAEGLAAGRASGGRFRPREPASTEPP